MVEKLHKNLFIWQSIDILAKVRKKYWKKGR